MSFINNLSVRVKLLILTVPLSIALIIACVVMGVEMNSVEEEVTGVYYDTLFTVSDNLINADRDFYQARVADYKGDKQDFDDNMQQTYDRVHEADSVASKSPTLYNDVLAGTSDSIANLISKFDQHYEAALAAGDAGDEAKYEEEFELAREVISEMTDITEQWAIEEHSIIQNEIRGKIIGLSIAFGILIIVLILIAVIVIRQIRGGISTATDHLKELASGKLNIELVDDDKLSKDEIGQMQSATNMLAVKLKEIMSRSNEMARSLTSAGEELASSSDQASQASGQVTLAVDEISQGAVSQATSVENAAGNTNDIGNDIEVIASNVEQLDTFAGEMKATCNEAMDALEKLVEQTRELRGSVKNIDDTIRSTNESANGIHEFVNAITSIASQTNLLSLNASIEAARAGEMGKGFAVVAESIGNLANQSAESAAEIRSIIDELTKQSEQSVMASESVEAAIDEEQMILDETKKRFDILNTEITNSVEDIRGISSQTESLENIKSTIVENVSDLSAISEENAASTQEVTASMENIAMNIRQISDDSEGMNDIAKDLVSSVGEFSF